MLAHERGVGADQRGGEAGEEGAVQRAEAQPRGGDDEQRGDARARGAERSDDSIANPARMTRLRCADAMHKVGGHRQRSAGTPSRAILASATVILAQRKS